MGEIIIFPPPETRGRKRRYKIDRPSTVQERIDKFREQKYTIKKENIAVLDMETDPFNNSDQEIIYPFCACLYSHHFDPVIIWNENHDEFIQEVFEAIQKLPEKYTIYAHNGGKFDWMFLVHRLRGKVQFKGRGIMSAKIGGHELRDSFHIIPEKLAIYHKEEFDYTKMHRGKRNKYKDEIIKYLISDCEYLLEIVQAFVDKFGMKLSIGQAAMFEIKKNYDVKKIGENTDKSLREYFFGGRVECLQGRGLFKGDYKTYDVNSMYPYVMANFLHPIGCDYIKRRRGGISKNTVFLEIRCRNFGAFVRRNKNNETSALEKYGIFKTTIWEFETACDLNLIDNVEILSVIDCNERENFSKFVNPLYDQRQKTKAILKSTEKYTKKYFETKREDLFLKLLLNNGFGKFAQNPRKYKDSYITDAESEPPDGYEDYPIPFFDCPIYQIWQKPSKIRRYNNVGTAASITGAARALLMRGINFAENPIYCDTDSIICKKLHGFDLDPIKLGSWDIEDEYSQVIICGKKLYAGKLAENNNDKIRAKGVSGLVWGDFEKMLNDESIEWTSPAPTLTKTGKQFYLTRNIRATANWQ